MYFYSEMTSPEAFSSSRILLSKHEIAKHFLSFETEKEEIGSEKPKFFKIQMNHMSYEAIGLK